MKKVLWLVSWYPNARDPFSGDFIKRQAEAVSAYQPLKVFFSGKGTAGITNLPVQANTGGPNLEEQILLYPSTQKNSIFSAPLSFISYIKKHQGLIRQLQIKNELPDIVHVHVAMKSGLIALYMKWKFGIPYLVTEHWTGYYRESADSLFKKSWLTKYMTRMILKNAFCLLPVSEALGKQINQHWASVPFRAIPNVVDTRYFFYEEKKSGEKFRFLHVSTMNHQKNPEGILRVFVDLLKHGFDAELILVGPLPLSLKEFILREVPDPRSVICKGEISYQQVSMEMKEASALVLFSNYENLPCVILESLCTGLPVIATRVGGVPELIQNHNGLLVDAGNERQLLDAMKTIIQNESHYDRVSISQSAVSRYSYEKVGKDICQVYETMPPVSS
jgi:glycosyltransferase involved in cell wall biosynthesis